MTAHEPVAAAVTLDDLMRQLVAIRALLEDERRPTPLNRADHELLTRLLPAIAGAFGSEPFASRDLFTAAGVRVVVRDSSVKRIGQLLGRGVGTPINGLVIERAGHELSVCLWRLGAC